MAEARHDRRLWVGQACTAMPAAAGALENTPSAATAEASLDAVALGQAEAHGGARINARQCPGRCR